MPGTPILFDIPENSNKKTEMRLQLANKPLIMSGIFIENKADACVFPLIMSGFGRGSTQLAADRTRQLYSEVQNL
jgi:hypothetical protein